MSFGESTRLTKFHFCSGMKIVARCLCIATGSGLLCVSPSKKRYIAFVLLLKPNR